MAPTSTARRHGVRFSRSKGPARVTRAGEEDIVRNLLCAVVVALVGISMPTIAQETVKKSTTKISVDDGKEVAVTGCVAKTPEGELSLTHAAGKDGALGSYILIAKDDERKDLEEHVGH